MDFDKKFGFKSSSVDITIGLDTTQQAQSNQTEYEPVRNLQYLVRTPTPYYLPTPTLSVSVSRTLSFSSIGASPSLTGSIQSPNYSSSPSLSSYSSSVSSSYSSVEPTENVDTRYNISINNNSDRNTRRYNLRQKQRVDYNIDKAFTYLNERLADLSDEALYHDAKQ